MRGAVWITAACIGNHDFDFGTENLEKLIGDCNFPWLLSNVVSKHDGQQLAHGKRTLIVEHEGWKLGFMGLIEKEWLATLATIEPDEVVYTDFVEAAHELAAELKAAGCDLVIATTHSRVPNDTRLAKECPELDLILGGHDHDAWREVVSGVPVIKSGTDFRELTEVTISPPAAGETKCAVDWKVIDITGDLPEDPAAAALVAEDAKELAGSMDKIIGSIGVPLDTRACIPNSSCTQRNFPAATESAFLAITCTDQHRMWFVRRLCKNSYTGDQCFELDR